MNYFGLHKKPKASVHPEHLPIEKKGEKKNSGHKWIKIKVIKSRK
jgi:hypothetical protein